MQVFEMVSYGGTLVLSTVVSFVTARRWPGVLIPLPQQSNR